MWLNHAKSRAWGCETCTPKERRLRGNCGGPFVKGVKHGIEDEKGAIYVPAYRIAPDCDPEWGDTHFYTCPVAGSHQCASVLNYYQLSKSGIIKITDLIQTPTPAFLEALTVLKIANDIREHRVRKQMEIENG